MGQSPLDKRLGEFRLEQNGLVQVSNGVIKLPHMNLNQRSDEIALRIMGHDLDDLVEVAKRPIQLAQPKVRLPALSVGVDKVRISLDDLNQIQHSLPILTQVLECDASVEIAINQVGPESQRFSEILDGSLVLAKCAVSLPPARMGLCVVRLKSDCLTEVLDSLLWPAQLSKDNPSGQKGFRIAGLESNGSIQVLERFMV